jgi:hypothetical protein
MQVNGKEGQLPNQVCDPFLGYIESLENVSIKMCIELYMTWQLSIYYVTFELFGRFMKFL